MTEKAPLSAIGPCPHCGRTDDVYINIRAYGWAIEYFTIDGEYESLDIDTVRYTNATTIRCASCHHERRDLELEDGERRRIRRKR